MTKSTILESIERELERQSYVWSGFGSPINVEQLAAAIERDIGAGQAVDRNAVIEECAMVCDKRVQEHPIKEDSIDAHLEASFCAIDIRALAGPLKPPA